MKKNKLFSLIALVGLAAPSMIANTAAAQDFRVHDRARGELSPETQAPTRSQLMAALDASSTPASAIAALLEYGERVECHECVPLLQRRMVDPDQSPVVREMAAWWLRRRPFGFGQIMYETRTLLVGDADTGTAPASDPRVRAVAADAIGEFMDPHGVDHLGRALMTDSDVRVRVAAVRGLARINAPSGLTFISTALRDDNAEVVDAALSNVLRVNFFRDHSAVIDLLMRDEVSIRRRAALVLGTLDVAEAVPALAAMLVSPGEDESVRVASAWALGQIGTTDARAALNEARTATGLSTRIRDAVNIALQM